MKCVYCHGSWQAGARCACGAVYHEDCLWEMKKCATLGCKEFLMIGGPKQIRPPSILTRIRDSFVHFFATPPAPKRRRSSMHDRIHTALNSPTLENLNDVI